MGAHGDGDGWGGWRRGAFLLLLLLFEGGDSALHAPTGITTLSKEELA